MNNTPVFKDVVLVGGGHTHALLIRKWAMRPLPGVRLTLVSPGSLTPYSGMLPGLIAGHYDYREMHIDLATLCQKAGVRLLLDQAVGLDPRAKRLSLAGRPAIGYDLLSLDIGSTPDTSVPGVREHAVPVKPIAGFHRRWLAVREQLRADDTARDVVVAGGGAGAVETVLAMAWAVREDARIRHKPRFTLVAADERILPGYHPRVVREAQAACARLGVTVRAEWRVQSVQEESLQSAHGEIINYDHLFWCTQASAAGWLAASGLDCDAAGFVRVNGCLQSTSHADIFAAGDIAHLVPNPRPKAGVYAVREAPCLFDNLRRRLLGQALRVYRPQDRFLSLLALGGKRAAGGRGSFAVAGGWVWRWKNRIDQRFMQRFRDLPPMQPMSEVSIPDSLIEAEERGEILDPAVRCCGCGGKIGAGVLGDVLAQLTGRYDPEDASVCDWPANTLIQTIDQIKAPVDDPWLFGRIAVFHALNDLLAMNAAPHSLQLALSLPFAGRAVQKRELRQVLEGVVSACRELDVELLGGHSAEGAEMALAVSANGVPGTPAFGKQGARAGDVLVLSKPLGSGLLLAGSMSGHTRGEDLAAVLDLMNGHQRDAARWLAGHGVKACTDISGFGLLGHLSEMLADPSLRARLDTAAIPVMSGARELVEQGVRSSLHPQNEAMLAGDACWEALREDPLWPVLLDPQTSGGLLAAIDPGQADAAEAAGFRVIGRVEAAGSG